MAEYWTAEKLQEAAITELLQHGGNKADIALLRAEFDRASKTNKQIESGQIEVTDIPS
jgi:hypothetical protein